MHIVQSNFKHSVANGLLKWNICVSQKRKKKKKENKKIQLIDLFSSSFDIVY